MAWERVSEFLLCHMWCGGVEFTQLHVRQLRIIYKEGKEEPCNSSDPEVFQRHFNEGHYKKHYAELLSSTSVLAMIRYQTTLGKAGQTLDPSLSDS